MKSAQKLLGRKIWAFGFTIPMATDGSLACLVESSSGIPSRCSAVGTLLCAAHSKVPALTRYLRALAFSITSDHCVRKRGRERVRLACARLLVGHRAGTLERLEMAAQKQGHYARSTRKLPRS